MATFLHYNTINLDFIKTIGFNQEPVYSDDGMDYIATKITISVNAVFNTKLMPATSGETPAQVIDRVTEFLMTPQKTLVFGVGGDTILNITGPDTRHGPFPKAFNVTQISGSETFLIHYEIETYLYDKCETDQPYVSNRWSDEVTMDENFYTQRIRSGKITFKGDADLNPDDYRDLIVPDLIKGFKRVSSHYMIQSDGLALAYQFVDQEVYKTPIYPATKFEGQYSVTSELGLTFNEECTVRVWGHKKVSKSVLLSLAALIIQGRLTAGNINGMIGIDKFIKNAYISDSLHENMVEMRLATQGAKTDYKITFYGAFIGTANLDKIYADDNVQAPPDPGLRGTALLKFANVLFTDPCEDEPNNDCINQESAFEPTPASCTTSPAIVTFMPVVPNLNSHYITPTTGGSGFGGVYSYYTVDISYKTGTNVLQFPLTTSQLTINAFAQVGNNSIVKTVIWEAEKVGGFPKVPAWNSANNNEVLLDYQVMPAMMDVDSSGQDYVYKIKGVYTYGIINTNTNIFKLKAANPPFLDSVCTDTVWDNSRFVTGISDC